MRLVATSDTHSTVDLSLIPDGDVFVHAGDLMSSGYLSDWEKQLEWLAELPHKTKYFIPGNHDFHMQLYPGPALQDLRKIGVSVLGFPGNNSYATEILPNLMIIGGCPFVDGLGERWAFGKALYNTMGANPQDDISRLINSCDVIVTHSPIYQVLDYAPYRRFGNKMFKTVLDEYPPEHIKVKHWIHGHVHEQYGSTTYNDINFYNVALCDRNQSHVNPPLVLDL